MKLTRLGLLFFILVGAFCLFAGYMLFQDTTYPKSSLQEMRPIARGQFTILRDCYNVPKYYIDANSLPVDDWTVGGKDFPCYKMDNRKEWIYVTSLKEGFKYNLYVREGLLKNYYFVECVN